MGGCGWGIPCKGTGLDVGTALLGAQVGLRERVALHALLLTAASGSGRRS